MPGLSSARLAPSLTTAWPVALGTRAISRPALLSPARRCHPRRRGRSRASVVGTMLMTVCSAAILASCSPSTVTRSGPASRTGAGAAHRRRRPAFPSTVAPSRWRMAPPAAHVAGPSRTAAPTDPAAPDGRSRLRATPPGRASRASSGAAWQRSARTSTPVSRTPATPMLLAASTAMRRRPTPLRVGSARAATPATAATGPPARTSMPAMRTRARTWRPAPTSMHRR